MYLADLSGPFNTGYQTLIKLFGVTKDRYVGRVDLDILESEVRQNFGLVMLRKGVQVRVVLMKDGNKVVRDIDPRPFQGDPLEVVEYLDSAAGKVSIELFRAPRQRGGRKGKVQVMRLDGDFGVPMSAFVQQARPSGLWDFVSDAATVLSSGFFEGCVRCENITLRQDRESFDYDEALHGLYSVISTWYEEHGQGLYEEEQEEHNRSRYEDLGNQSLERLREQFPDADWKRFGQPTPDPQGEEEVQTDTEGDDSGKKSGTRGGSGGGGGGDPAGGTGEPKKPTRQKSGGPGDTGGGGKNPTTVNGSSQGLTFRYDEMLGNSHLWEFEFRTGTLVLNIRHPLWTSLDETDGKHTARNDRWLMGLQEFLGVQLLTVLAHFPTEDELDKYRTLIDMTIKPNIALLIKR